MGRALPWRETHDAYRVWISEIMLQQTTVVAVMPYFERFLAKFPTLADLAAADEPEVLRLWEGLGYYSRARNLHRTAQILVTEQGGVFPSDVAALQRLPGIGRYTAGAIASFAFDRPAPIVEANTLRLYCRLLGYDGDPRSSAGQAALWEFAEQLVPPRSPGRFNQALMELGSQVCTPTAPACPQCPVRPWCAAAEQGRQHEIPRPPKRPAITAVTEDAVVVVRDGRCLLTRRRPGERWAGLWDFPRFATEPESDEDSDLVRRLQVDYGVVARLEGRLGDIRHSVTRFRITLRCHWAVAISQAEPAPREIAWVAPADFGELALSKTGRQLALRVTDELGGSAGVGGRLAY